VSQELDKLLDNATQAISQSQDLAALDSVRVAYLGKKGEITSKLKSLGQISPDLRPAAGQAINQIKLRIQALLEERKSDISFELITNSLSSDTVDVSLPG
jgi:phenylalanyl-tRNA synthetase alpha chain